MTASLRILSSKADSNTWESFTKSGMKLALVHQESPRPDVFRKRATKKLLKPKQRQMYLTWAKVKKEYLGYVCNPLSLMEGTEMLCRDDIGDLLGSPNHL